MKNKLFLTGIFITLMAIAFVASTGFVSAKDTGLSPEELLGKEAKFPAGPFMLASRLNVPVLFVYVMKETNKHYHLYARKSQAKHRDAQALLKEYTQSVTWMLKKHPLQWFNYFDFWNALK